MKFQYKDRVAAREYLVERLRQAQIDYASAKSRVEEAKQHLANTPDRWKYVFSLFDPHSMANRVVEAAKYDLWIASQRFKNAQKCLDEFDSMDGWDSVEINGEANEDD